MEQVECPFEWELERRIWPRVLETGGNRTGGDVGTRRGASRIDSSWPQRPMGRQVKYFFQRIERGGFVAGSFFSEGNPDMKRDSYRSREVPGGNGGIQRTVVRAGTRALLAVSALWLFLAAPAAVYSSEEKVEPPPAPQAPARVVENPGGVDEHRARRAAIYERLVRDAERIEEPVVASPSEEQLRDLREQRCDDCPSGVSRRFRVGVGVRVDQEVTLAELNPDDVSREGRRSGIGFVRALEDGTIVWTTRMESPGAERISVHFEELDLPEGVELYVYNDEGEFDGPYTGDGGLGTGSNWTIPLSGDTLGVELRVPANAVARDALRRIEFKIAAVNHLGDGTLSGRRAVCPGLEDCIENAECFDTSDFSGIDDLRRGVAHILFQVGSDFFVCSGGLVTTNPPGVGDFFLTANHCFDTQASATSARFFWDYRMPECSDGSCPASSGFPNQQGSTLRFTSGDQDVTFLELNATPPGTRTYLGWTAVPVHNQAGTQLHRIHHPAGSPQMYTKQTVNTTSGVCGGLPRGNYIYSDDTVGATQGGSSGSVVVNGNSQVVGQLLGACGPVPDNPCGDNRAVDGAFAQYFSNVQQWLAPDDDGPPNNLFPGATIAGASGSVGGTTIDATREPGEPNHAGVGLDTGSVWYSWTAPQSDTVSFSTCTFADYDTTLAVYTGSAVDSLTEIAYNDDAPGCGLRSRVTFAAQSGTVYRIAVSGFGAAAGDFTLDWGVEEECLITLVAPESGATIELPQTFTWSESGSCGSSLRLAFATSTTPSNVVHFPATTPSLVITEANWDDMKGSLGEVSTYYWTIGETRDDGFFYFLAPLRAINDAAPGVPEIDIEPTEITLSCDDGRRAPARTVEGLFGIAAEDHDLLRRATGDEETIASVSVSASALADLVSSGQRVTVSGVPLSGGDWMDFDFERFSVVGSSTRVVETDGITETPIALPRIDQFHGESTTDSSVFAYLGVTEDSEVWLVVWEGDGRSTIVRPDTSGGPGHLIGRASDPDASTPFCNGYLVPDGDTFSPGFLEPITQTRRSDTTLQADIMIDVGNTLYQNTFGSNSTTATNYVTNLLGAASAIYLRDINVVLQLGPLHIWTSSDPFAGSDSLDQLVAYRDYNRSNRSGVDRSLAHLLAHQVSYGGIAYLNVLCNRQWDYGVSNINGAMTFPASGYAWDIYVLAHELGHNFGTGHTHCYNPPIDCCYVATDPSHPEYQCSDCTTAAAASGTIMSYCHLWGGSNITMQFHERVIDVMRPTAVTASCLTEVELDGTLVIRNHGSGPLDILDITTDPEANWLGWSPQAPFSVPAGGQQPLILEANCGLVPPGGAQTTLLVTSNDPEASRNPFEVTVNVTSSADCSVALDPVSREIPAEGASGQTVAVNASASDCEWEASVNVGWIAITGGSSGVGDGTVTYSVQENLIDLPRAGTITVLGQTHTVSQAAATSAGPPNDMFPGTTLTGPGYDWIAEQTNVGATRQSGEPEHWPGSTSGSVWYTWTAPANGLAVFHTCVEADFGTVIAVYTGDAINNLTLVTRNGDAAVDCVLGGTRVEFPATAGTPYRIAVTGRQNQEGMFDLDWVLDASQCTFGIDPLSRNIPAEGATGQTIAITTSAGCEWNASTTDGWIEIVGDTSGTDGGTVTYSVAPNPSEEPRVGTISIEDAVHTVMQDGATPSEPEVESDLWLVVE